LGKRNGVQNQRGKRMKGGKNCGQGANPLEKKVPGKEEESMEPGGGENEGHHLNQGRGGNCFVARQGGRDNNNQGGMSRNRRRNSAQVVGQGATKMVVRATNMQKKPKHSLPKNKNLGQKKTKKTFQEQTEK